MFFALQGENTDGHNFVSQAFHNGAKYAIISDTNYKINKNCLVVENVFDTLVQLAMYKRNKLNIPFLGITGSAGKTTTKELCKEILSKKIKVFATHKSFNSKFTLPLSILHIPKDCQIAVLEMGASSIGDIKRHCEIARPTHGIITSIHDIHLSGFGSKENIIKGKTELYDFLYNNNGVIFVNHEDSILMNQLERYPDINSTFYQKDNSNTFLLSQKTDFFLTYLTPQKDIISTHFFGDFNLDNIAAASTIATYFGIPDDDIADAVSKYVPENNRSQVVVTEKGNKVILDAYNANFFAIVECVKLFSSLNLKNKTIILGAMLELADKVEEFHKHLGKILNKVEAENIFLVGEDMKYCADVCKKAIHFYNKEVLKQYLLDKKFKESNFFIKGARFWKLEELLTVI